MNCSELIESTTAITKNMDNRGGGILSLELIDKSKDLKNYFQLEVRFDTCDAMGANFINSVLEKIASQLKSMITVDISMSILSNYTPECLVRAFVECPIEELGKIEASYTNFENQQNTLQRNNYYKNLFEL